MKAKLKFIESSFTVSKNVTIKAYSAGTCLSAQLKAVSGGSIICVLHLTLCPVPPPPQPRRTCTQTIRPPWSRSSTSRTLPATSARSGLMRWSRSSPSSPPNSNTRSEEKLGEGEGQWGAGGAIGFVFTSVASHTSFVFTQRLFDTSLQSTTKLRYKKKIRSYSNN